METQEKQNKKTFEQSLKRLEEIVLKLESGDVPLEETIALFQEGIQLVNFCNQKLEEVKHKVEIVIRNKNGFTLQPFEEKNNNKFVENEIKDKDDEELPF
ncbi:MAG: exodeoxyribonuclease VII small subunit [Endomicrobiia bacterium]